MLRSIGAELLERWDVMFPRTDRPKKLYYLGLPGSIEGGTTTFLAFGHSGTSPICAIKIHRSPDRGAGARNEERVLARVHRRGSLSSRGVPQILICRPVADVWVTAQSIMPGSALQMDVGADGVPNPVAAGAMIRDVLQWLELLHRDTVTKEPDVLGPVITRCRRTIQQFRRLFPLCEYEIRCVQELASSAETLVRSGACVVHGDFCRHNILLDDRGQNRCLSVIDWTYGRAEGLPLQDAFFFITTLFWQMRTDLGIKGYVRAFENTYLNINPYSRLVTKEMAALRRALAIQDDIVEGLFGYFLIDSAVAEYRRVAQCSRAGWLPRTTLRLAHEQGLGYADIQRAQVWRILFRVLAQQRRGLRLSR